MMLVLPFAAASVILHAHWWAVNWAPVAMWALGLSALLGLAAWKLRSATAGGAFTGAVVTASLMFSTTTVPYLPWETALVPVVVVLVLAGLATRLGAKQKQRMGIGESRNGRTASQVAANIGVATLVCDELAQSWLHSTGLFQSAAQAPAGLFAVGLAALAEAAADTVSSEIGQVIGGRPRMLTTMRSVEPWTDGAVSPVGTLSGIAAAGAVAAAGALALGGGAEMFAVGWAGGVFGLFFDSLLGATAERRGWLNNDMVNFLATASAAAFALALLALLPSQRAG